jgi:2-alkyl-3-oxoalkanoate reductase
MRIFVTGATGVIGRRLVPLLRASGHEVTAGVRSAASALRLARHGASIAEVDLFDRRAVERAVAGHDAVINLATRIPKPARMFLPWAWRENDRLRKVASNIIADACITTAVPRLLQESFAPAYPGRGEEWIDETTPIEPVKYSRTIADAEAAAARFSGGGSTGIVLRFAGFYGPDAFQTTELIKAVRKGWAPLPGPPDVYFSSISHDDAATAVASVLTLPAGAYNIVDDEPVTHRVLVDSLANALGVPPPKLPPTWLTPLFGSIGEMASRSQRMSNRKLKSASGWKPRFPSVREGWRDIVAHLDAGRAVAA